MNPIMYSSKKMITPAIMKHGQAGWRKNAEGKREGLIFCAHDPEKPDNTGEWMLITDYRIHKLEGRLCLLPENTW